MKLRNLFSPFLLLMVLAGALSSSANAHESELYELRTYRAFEGRLDDLHARFRDHVMALFEKHGIRNIAYWTPVGQADTLIYLIAHKDANAARASWAAFVADPVWQAVDAKSHENGPLVQSLESVFMTPTEYTLH